MGDIRDTANDVYRNYVTAGIPASGVYEPPKADIRALFGVVEDELDALEASQAAGQVVAETWAALSGYPTDSRAVGDYGKVVGADAGTHTDPVAGGTVANEGLYRWSASPAGWKRIADLDADDAATSADAAAASAAAAAASAALIRAPAGMHTSGMLRQWLFDEREGETVANILNPGTGDIDLTLATDPNVEWTTKGVRITDGLIQTDGAVTGVRTIATLYRAQYGANEGLFISAGNPATHGTLAGLFAGATQPGFTYYVANGSGIAPLAHDDNGQGAHRVNRGGWLLVFIEFPAPYDTPIGWGGRADYTTWRTPELDVAWAGAWSDVLTDDEREQVFVSVRALARPRGIYLHWEDCPQQVDCVRFLGQSGVTGYSLISEITSADTRARTQPASSVLVSHQTGIAGEWLTTETFQFKYNHRAQGSLGEIQSKMGPMPGAAFAHEDNRANRRRKLLICQSAQDSTSVTLNPAYTQDRTWNAGTLKTGGMLWASMRHWWTIEQHLLSQGIGPRLRSCWYFQGEEDGQSFSTPSTLGDDMQDLWDAEKLYIGAGDEYDMKLIKTPLLGRAPYGTSNGFVAAQIDIVRSGQETFAGANGDVELIDCDDLGLDANEHFDGQASLVVGQRLYEATTQIETD